MTERLDRIEAVLAGIAESQQRSEMRLDRIEQLTDNLALLTGSNSRAIESNARAIAAHGEELRTSIADMVSVVGTVAASLQRQADQAEIDRAEFRAQFQQLIEALSQQFNGNGHRE